MNTELTDAGTAFTDQPFHVMTKPIGPICNLDCTYCYYLHKEELYPRGNKWKMTDDCLESYIAQYIRSQPPGTSEITFAWQGGEPTLLGLDFFERCVEIQQKHERRGMSISNTLQTNGVLLDDDWCRFFLKHRFLIGLSIDGPADLHDEFRVDHQGAGSHSRVMAAMRKLRKFGVEYNALVVVNRHNGAHGGRIYRYLRDAGCRYVQFIPIVEKQGIGRHAETDAPLTGFTAFDKAQSAVSSRSVLPEQFGQFLIDVFDEWVQRDVGRVFVQIFDQALSAWVGVEPSLCVFRRTCGRALAMEHNGDVYSCDHFVEPEHLLGNVNVIPLEELVNSGQQQAFGDAKLETLPQYCLDCEVRHACNGECPKNRFLMTPDGAEGLNYLCAGYRAFFNHIDGPMQKMAQLLKQRRSPALIMEAARGKHTPGRNDPCPCGSGRKFKSCCQKNGS
ncbi:MAG: anaerobic sulfatase maturase [Planctomycetaceae bacterium]|nr:anaerobic sulfatase maturase [Planctomycetaceae bacterium]